MTGLIKTWILGIVGTAVFCALAEELSPEGRVKRVQKFICGVVMTLALVAPLTKMNLEDYALNLAIYQRQAEAVGTQAAEISDGFSRTFIEQRCASYILDKAKIYGLDIKIAEVGLAWSAEGVWYPVEAQIEGEYDRRLSDDLESELGIGRESQYWSGIEDD